MLLVFIFAIVLIDAVLLAFAPDPAEADVASITDSGLAVTLIMFTQWVITIAVPLTYFMIRGYRLTPAVLGFRRTRFWRAAGWLFVVLAATSFLQIVYGWLIQTLGGENQLPSDVPSQDVTALYGTTVGAFILTFVAVALITPVVEELFFRGIIHRGLEQQLGFLPGGALSAFIFAMAHIDYRLFVPIFGLGFGLAFLVHKTGSIWPGIGGHFIINSLGVIAQYANLGNGE
ncbi:MAG: type II CAAX endopeptidase family protein [Thermoleophilia bacterium]|nr:type II CAAX endopeptidase family protein [Thermoleophilia bacterium]